MGSVAPFTGAWIEILIQLIIFRIGIVAPFTGAWIEIQSRTARMRASTVAPFTGAWIEMLVMSVLTKFAVSLPSRERGLK